MRTRKIGKSDIDASVVALGTWAFGGWMWGGTDEDAAIAAVHAALDAGISLIDTAPIYGFGLSEQIVGRALKDRRDRAVIATKCGMVTHPQGGGEFKFNATSAGYSDDGHIGVYLHLTPENLRRVQELIKSFQPVLDAHDITPAQLAIAWTHNQPGLTHALCGARNPKQAQENAVAGDVELTPEELQLIDEKLRAADL